MSFIDTHAHLFLCPQPLSELTAAATANNVIGIINVGTNIETSLTAQKQAKSNPIIYPAIGIHPSEHQDKNKLTEMADLLQNHKWAAVGEIGLDYYRNYTDPETQKQLFYSQLELAEQFKLPALIHNRQADSDIIEAANKFASVSIVFHCFASDLNFIKKTIADNRYYSFSGIITTKDLPKVFEALQWLPPAHLLLETDCPYLTPSKFKGQKNQPSFIIETAKKVAEIKSLSLDKIAQSTTANAKTVFGLNSL